MSLQIMRDARVRSVQWKDLLALSRWEIVKEPLLGVPWLAASLWLAHHGHGIAALAFSFVFFLTGLRLVHGAYHYALGLPRRATELLMFAMSIVMLSSMHALQVTHLHHHKHCMEDEDVEAASARMPGWRALACGPIFPLQIHRKALELASPAQQRWILAELACMAAWISVALFVLRIPAVSYHVVAMLLGQCFTAFFAVWTVHHDCDRNAIAARTVRSPLKSLIAFDMFFHLEHHLYPRVPTCRLHVLAERLDAAAPELSRLRVY